MSENSAKLKNIEIRVPSVPQFDNQADEDAGKIVKISKLDAEKSAAREAAVSPLSKIDVAFLKDHLSPEHFDTLMKIYEKTGEIKAHHKDYMDQINNLKVQLSGSSEFLNRMKKQIDNMKFSYQSKLIELNKRLDPGDCLEKPNPVIESAEEYSRYMENVTKKIENLRSKFESQAQKRVSVTDNYQKAFSTVVSLMQEIEKGSYHSQNPAIMDTTLDLP